MSASNTAIVVTTIQEPTGCMHELARVAQEHELEWIVIGDRKGPKRFSLAPAQLISIDEQANLPFKLARLLPEKHYARKNLGYLVAMSRGFDCIYETDDDNAPTDAWSLRTLEIEAFRVEPRTSARWANIYQAYTPETIWPRGLPLNWARRQFAQDFRLSSSLSRAAAPIQQGLANGAPDVDAVWRLVQSRDVTFDEFGSVLIPRGVWCPFNSQNTWWWRPAFPLLYLPSCCSFRMTDIWRSFVAQRCLWELGHELEFHNADVKQLRNEHDLMRDFEHETPGYLRNDEIRRLLDGCQLKPGESHLRENLLLCYEALVGAEVVASRELDLVQAWIDDCS